MIPGFHHSSHEAFQESHATSWLNLFGVNTAGGAAAELKVYDEGGYWRAGALPPKAIDRARQFAETVSANGFTPVINWCLHTPGSPHLGKEDFSRVDYAASAAMRLHAAIPKNAEIVVGNINASSYPSLDWDSWYVEQGVIAGALLAVGRPVILCDDRGPVQLARSFRKQQAALEEYGVSAKARFGVHLYGQHGEGAWVFGRLREIMGPQFTHALECSYGFLSHYADPASRPELFTPERGAYDRGYCDEAQRLGIRVALFTNTRYVSADGFRHDPGTGLIDRSVAPLPEKTIATWKKKLALALA